MAYRLEFTSKGLHDYQALSERVLRLVDEHLDMLQEDPRPHGVVALRGETSGNYRIRVGSHRIGYEVNDGTRTVTIWQIGDRKRFYERARRRRH
ncbi:MAG: type II toxin-antitoxin system RelE/ParE family toxin [Armatimonadia bacterium]